MQRPTRKRKRADRTKPNFQWWICRSVRAVVTVGTLSLLSLPHVWGTYVRTYPPWSWWFPKRFVHYWSSVDGETYLQSSWTDTCTPNTREASGEAFRREKRELSGLLPSSALNCACEHFFSHAFRLTSNKTRVAARGLQTFVQIKNINRHVSTLKPYSLYFYPVQFSVPSLSFSSLF